MDKKLMYEAIFLEPNTLWVVTSAYHYLEKENKKKMWLDMIRVAHEKLVELECDHDKA